MSTHAIESLKNEVKGILATKLDIFDGFNTKSTQKGSKRRAGGFVERYRTNFDGGLSFIANFINSLESAFNVSVKNPELLKYTFPSSKDIDDYISLNYHDANRYQIRENTLNKSPKTVSDWINKVKQTILSKESNSRDRVKFITSKVGSGKSTFIRCILEKYSTDFLRENIIITSIEYDDFNFDEGDPQFINIYIKELLCEKCVQSYLSSITNIELSKECPKFIQKLGLSENDNTRNIITSIFEDQIDSPKEKAEKLKRIKINSNTTVDENYLTRFFKYLTRAKDVPITFLITIDGFDILNPALIVKQKLYIDALKRIIFENLHEVTVYYLITLRSCTYEYFRRDNTQIKYLVSPSEYLILKNAIESVAEKNPFIAKNKDIFLKMFELILKKLEIIFSVRSYNFTLIQMFDYNYRFLLRYIEQIIYFLLDDYVRKYRIKSIDDIAYYVSKSNYQNFEQTLEQKWYVLLDILLLKNMPIYEPPYVVKKIDVSKQTYTLENSKDWGPEFLHKDIVSFVDNVYNYVLTEDMVSRDTLFPLLLKIRILQIHEAEGIYIDISTVKRKLLKLGYNTPYLESIIEDLHNAKFLKVICIDQQDSINNSKQYNITNRGKITINELALSSAYIDNVIPYILLPDIKNNIIKAVDPYLSYRKLDFEETDRELLCNFYFFINIIRCIEEEEWNLCKKDSYFRSFFIANKILENYLPTFEKRIGVNANDETNIKEYGESIRSALSKINYT